MHPESAASASGDPAAITENLRARRKLYMFLYVSALHITRLQYVRNVEALRELENAQHNGRKMLLYLQENWRPATTMERGFVCTHALCDCHTAKWPTWTQRNSNIIGHCRSSRRLRIQVDCCKRKLQSVDAAPFSRPAGAAACSFQMQHAVRGITTA